MLGGEPVASRSVAYELYSAKEATIQNKLFHNLNGKVLVGTLNDKNEFVGWDKRKLDRVVKQLQAKVALTGTIPKKTDFEKEVDKIAKQNLGEPKKPPAPKR